MDLPHQLQWEFLDYSITVMLEFMLQENEFVPWGTSHLAVLVLLLAAALILVCLGRRHRATGDFWFRRLFASAILTVQLPLQIFSMLPAQWGLEHSLPLQLCDLAWMVAVYTLWTRSERGFALLYYWGLTLTSQALLTPHLDFDFPHVQSIMFWASHSLELLAAVYVTWGAGMRPDWRSYRFATAMTAGWAVTVFSFNSIAGTNYGYLNAKPPGRSILDLLGEWPVYVFVELVAGAALWALITLPWRRRARSAAG